MKEMKTLTIGGVQYVIVDGNIGPLEELGTVDKSSVVAAINEVASKSGVSVETDPTVPAWAKAATKPTYTASEVGALPNTTVIPSKLADLTADSTHRLVTDSEKSTWNAKANVSDIPTKISELTNDSGFMTGYTETDPTVPAWAKASSKPSYTKSEVGLGNVDNVKQYSASNPPPYPVTKVNGQTGDVTITVPTKVSQLQNDTGYLTQHQDISGKADKNAMTLGIHTDGLIYLFVDGAPVGTGIELPTGGGDVYGYVDSENNIVLNGALTDGSYSIKYEMDDGSTVDIGNLVLDNSTYYSVTNNLTNCVSSNSTTRVVEGESYSATISANSGYELKSVAVTMGGVDVTDDAWVSVTNVYIASVTGDVVITAVAEEIKAAEPVTVDIALRDGVRLGSDGGDRNNVAGYCATERIDLTNIPKPCSIHLTNARWCFATTSETGYVMTCARNASGTNLVATYTNDTIGSGYFTVVKNGGSVTDVTVTITSDAVAEICFSGCWSFVSSISMADAGTKATLTYTPAA